MVGKRVNNFGQAPPPPLFGQCPKELDFFYGRCSLIYQLKRKQTYDSDKKNKACHCVSQTWKAMGMAAGCNVWWTVCYNVLHCGGLSVKLCYTVLHCGGLSVKLCYIVLHCVTLWWTEC